ncbi:MULTISPECIES: hypothetical protein [Methanocalculus]|uniref:hypothetical protein n=1 Tax=Methanocalculus TaxID=71151 RepID=UPI0020A14F77|nr:MULTISPECIES: hypothetical protein [unclassified Methanocalculus]MCP1661501.1 Zn-dependent oligopeptidase [Methanocalculus sp. AMF5]
MRTIPSPGKLICIISLVLITGALIGTAGCLGDTRLPFMAQQAEEQVEPEYAPGEIPLLIAKAEREARAGFDAIAEIPADKRTFENTILAFDTLMTGYSDVVLPILLVGYANPNPTVREEGKAVSEPISKFLNETYGRLDLYDALADPVPRTAGERQLQDAVLRRFEKQGLNPPDDQV